MNKLYDLGHILEGNQLFQMTEEELERHVFVAGDIGSGKSRWNRQLLREHRRHHRGFCQIESGDLWADTLADFADEIMRTGNRSLLKKIHVVSLNPFQMARFDPFRFECPASIHPELRESARQCWRHTKVMAMALVFQHVQNQMGFEGMPRLERIITDVLTFVSTAVNGRHLSVAQGQILLDLEHPLHDAIYRGIASSGEVPREILSDFEVLHNMRRVEDVRRETESTLNRFRALFGPAMKSLLSGTGTEPCLDIAKIIQRGDYLIVNVSKSLFVSEDQNAALAQLVISDVFEAVLNTPRQLRRGFTLLIDEAQKYIQEHIGTMMREARKHKLSIVLSTPDLSGLNRKDIDLRPTVLSIPKTKIVFGTTLPEDTEILARVMYSGNLDFTPLTHEVERHSYEWIKKYEKSYSVNATENWGKTDTITKTETHSHQDSRGTSTGTGTANQVSHQETKGGVDTLSKPKHGNDRPEQKSHAESATVGNGSAVTNSSTTTETASSSDSVAKGHSQGTASQQGGAQGESFSISEKDVMVPIITLEVQATGQLERSVSDQLEFFRQKIATRSDRQAAVKSPASKKAIEIQTIDANDPFPTAESTMKMVEWIQRELWATHAYYHTPNMDPREQEAVLRRQLGLEQEADEPEVVQRNQGPEEKLFED